MHYIYTTKGTCAWRIEIDLDGEIIKNVKFYGGCAGNTLGIQKVVKGMHAKDVIEQFRGIPCGNKKTSCPDQLAIALQEALGLMKDKRS